MSEGLFEIEPAPIRLGDRVKVTTIYGYELGLVVEKYTDREGFPMVKIRTRSGEEIALSIARAEKLEHFGPTSVVPDVGDE
jgi:hypothetical protein